MTRLLLFVALIVPATLLQAAPRIMPLSRSHKITEFTHNNSLAVIYFYQGCSSCSPASSTFAEERKTNHTALYRLATRDASLDPRRDNCSYQDAGLRFAACNLDTKYGPCIAESYNLEDAHTFVLFQGGKEVGRTTNVEDLNALLEELWGERITAEAERIRELRSIREQARSVSWTGPYATWGYRWYGDFSPWYDAYNYYGTYWW